MATPTRTLAAFAATLSYEAIPTVVREATKQYLLDTIGCGIYGLQTSWAKTVNQLILEQGGRPEATLWLEGFRGPANTVALGLGVMAHSFELDDYHSGAKLHPGAVVIPAALAVAERQGASGRDLLRAIVAGYELMIRTSLAAGSVASVTKPALGCEASLPGQHQFGRKGLRRYRLKWTLRCRALLCDHGPRNTKAEAKKIQGQTGEFPFSELQKREFTRLTPNLPFCFHTVNFVFYVRS